MLCGTINGVDPDNGADELSSLPAHGQTDLNFVPATKGPGVQNAAPNPGQTNGTDIWGGGPYASAATTFATNAAGLPQLNSLPGAPFSIYLDFDGYNKSGTAFLPYDTDGAPSTFSSTEQTAIAEGWRRLADYYSPFDVNVTTISPGTGNNFAWEVISNSGGGYSYGRLGASAFGSINGSTDLLSRTSGLLHEIGHDFGLAHQSTYDANSALIREYRYSIDSIHGVIMGVDFDGYPSKYIVGHTINSGESAVLDDLNTITGKIKVYEPTGGDGYRADDYSGVLTSATPLNTVGSVQSAYGIIERLTDSDAFSFTSSGGSYKVSLTPDSPSSLDGKLDVYNSTGTMMAEVDPPTDISATVSLNLPAGTYYAVASSHGNYDDIGGYLLSVTTTTTTAPTFTTLTAPANPAVALGTGSDLSLSWSAVSGATSYAVYRSSDGVNFASVGTTTATTYNDPNLFGSARYFYSIHAVNASGTGQGSAVVSLINRPSAVTAFRVATFSSTTLVLDWVETTGETGYRVERSVDATTWSTLATVAANQVSYTDAALAANTTYYYRVTPTSAIGDGVAVTSSDATRLAAVTNFVFTAKNPTSLSLGWTNVTGNTGYQVERSLNGTTWAVLTTLPANTVAYTDPGLTPVSPYYYRVEALNGSVIGTTPTAIFAATPALAPLPAGWTSADIGSVGGSGASKYQSGAFTLVGSGADIFGTTDAFRYDYATLTGNGQIVARIASQTNTNTNAKAGVMIRATTAANSPQVAVEITPGGLAYLQYRSTSGGSTSSVSLASIAVPYWVKLVRTGNSFSGYVSPDGVTWAQVGSAITVTMSSAVTFGLVDSSHDNTLLSTTSFDNVSGTGLVAPPLTTSDLLTVQQKLPGSINVLSNDTDPGGNTLTLTNVTTSGRGTMTYNSSGGITYTASTTTAGVETLTYTVSNGTQSTTDTLTVTELGLVAGYKLDESAGTVANDYSTNAFNGNITNGTFVTGLNGNALSLNGTSTTVNLGTNPSADKLEDFTVSAWIKTSATTAGEIIQQRDINGFNGEYGFSMNSAGTLNFYLYGDNANQFNFSTTAKVNDGKWHQVVAERSGLTGRIYIDGTLSASATGTAIRNLSGGISTWIGSDSRNLSTYFNGLIDTVGIYNEAIAPALINLAPTVAAAAAASPATVTTNTATLTALGADDAGEAALSYTWTTTNLPSGAAAPVFGANGTHAAQTTTVTFSKAGSYTFQVTITDTYGAAATSSVTVVVNQKPTTLAPGASVVVAGGNVQFSVNDQFGNTIAPASITWATTGGGTINSTGLFTANQSGGSYTISATSGTSATTSITVVPTVYTGAVGSDTYALRLKPGDATIEQIFVNAPLSGSSTFSIATSLLSSLTFSPTGGDGSLTLDFSNGNPIPTGGLNYTGGANPTASGNSLYLKGSAAGALNFSINAAQLFYTPASSSPVSYSNLRLVELDLAGGSNSLTQTQQPAAGLIYNAGSGSNTLTITAGTYTLATDPQTGSGNLTVNDNASLVFAAPTAGSGNSARHLAALNLGASATAVLNTAAAHLDRTVLVVSALSINTSAQLDLGGNDLIIQNASALAVNALVGSGYNFGSWTGRGLVSSLAATDSTHLTTLAAIQNTNGVSALYPTFDGQTSTNSDVIVKYTYVADSTLDGMVDGSDYSRIDNGFTNHLTGWINGDYNFDGLINGSDYTLADNAYNRQGASLAAAIASPKANPAAIFSNVVIAQKEDKNKHRETPPGAMLLLASL